MGKPVTSPAPAEESLTTGSPSSSCSASDPGRSLSSQQHLALQARNWSQRRRNEGPRMQGPPAGTWQSGSGARGSGSAALFVLTLALVSWRRGQGRVCAASAVP